MAKQKDSFLMYYEWEDAFADLDDQQLGELLRAIFAYEKRKEEYTGADGAVRLVMRFVQRTLDRNQEKYQQVCARNRRNIAKRWQSDPENTTGKFGTENDTTGYQSIPLGTKNTDSDSDRDRDRDRDRGSDSDGTALGLAGRLATQAPVGAPPTREAVIAFVQSNGLKLDIDRFYRYYDDRRWLTQNGKPIDWRKRAKKWSASERSRAAPTVTPEQQAADNAANYEEMRRLLAAMKEEDNDCSRPESTL